MNLVLENGIPVGFKGRSGKPTEDKNKLLLPYGKQIRNFGVVFRLLPDAGQAAQIRKTIGCARFTRNRYLEDKIKAYQEGTAFPEHYLRDLKAAFPFLYEVDKYACETAVEHVDAAYKNFFVGRAAFPKFASARKPNGNAYQTKATNGNIALVRDKDGKACVKLPKAGLVRIVLPKGACIADYYTNGARITSAVIKRSGDVYTVSLQMEMILSKVSAANTISRDRIIGVDLGLKLFGAFGNDFFTEEVENPRWIKLHAKRLRRLQQALSRKQYNKKLHQGSRNWEKARKRVLKEQRKIADQRKDFHHKLSTRIAAQCDAFICEDLNIRGMMKNRHLAKSVAGVGWYRFLTYMKYKLERKGGRFVQVSRWYPSSQLCDCGYKNPAVKDLRIRAWTCPECGTYHDRDIHAMHNIVKEGIRLLKEDGVEIAEVHGAAS